MLVDQVERQQRVAQVVEHADEQHDVEALARGCRRRRPTACGTRCRGRSPRRRSAPGRDSPRRSRRRPPGPRRAASSRSSRSRRCSRCRARSCPSGRRAPRGRRGATSRPGSRRGNGRARSARRRRSMLWNHSPSAAARRLISSGWSLTVLPLITLRSSPLHARPGCAGCRAAPPRGARNCAGRGSAASPFATRVRRSPASSRMAAMCRAISASSRATR